MAGLPADDPEKHWLPWLPKFNKKEGEGHSVTFQERMERRRNVKEKVSGSGVQVIISQCFRGFGLGPGTESKLELVNIHKCDNMGFL